MRMVSGISRAGRITRRSMLGGVSACVVAPATLAATAAWERLPAVAALLAGSEPRRGGVALDVPVLTEDGSSVNVTVTAESPMTVDDHIVALHLFATRNPSPEIAAFHLAPGLGRAEISTRIRLNESQTVVAVARTSKGEVRVATQDVTVTTTGCLVPSDQGMAVAMQEPRVRVGPGRPAEVRTLIDHPMETGLRQDAQGRAVPERIVREVTATAGGTTLLRAELFRSVAANPYLRFFVGVDGPVELQVTWVEDTGARVSATAQVPSA